ncbi:pyrroline-5-carboxylate reductase [Candidatus Binatia bacterium]|nr:pyrroline-5-carboxylate reductase [Candidatus Binatia bacterium]
MKDTKTGTRPAAARKRATGAATSPRAVGIVGAGNMASALVKGWLGAGLYQPDELWVSDVDREKLAQFRRRFKITAARDNADLVSGSKVVVLAVKPQIIDTVLTQVRPGGVAGKLFISIAAGVPTIRIEAGLGPETRVLRVMPNTPALLGRGMSVMVRGRYATPADEKLGLKLLGAVGQAVTVPDERMLDAVTGLSGSGPAYVYLMVEGLITGGVHAGLPRALAVQLVLQTLRGAAAMLQETGETPEALRAQVTSPGGTTLAGLSELERRGFKDALAAAVVAATRRSSELGRGGR